MTYPVGLCFWNRPLITARYCAWVNWIEPRSDDFARMMRMRTPDYYTRAMRTAAATAGAGMPRQVRALSFLRLRRQPNDYYTRMM